MFDNQKKNIDNGSKSPGTSDTGVFVFIHSNAFSNSPFQFLTQWLLRNVLFNFQVFVNFPSFFFFTVIDFYFHSTMFREHTLPDFNHFFNLLKLVLWPRIWFILKSALCVLEKKIYIYYTVVGKTIL